MLFDFENYQLHPNWLVKAGHGPIMTTAVHAGRHIRDELAVHLNPDHQLARREEDPLTDVLASSGDNLFCCHNSRFEVDLNRPPETALSTDLECTWGVPIWQSTPPADAISKSMQQHQQFYTLMSDWLTFLIAEFGCVMVIDIHSYNHRRDGPDKPWSSAKDNPDIDLGMTTLDKARFGELANHFVDALKAQPCQGKTLDVRENVRYPDGGHWPEWIYENYKEHICTITLEYKKMYMNEWTNEANLEILEDLRVGLANAIQSTKAHLLAKYVDRKRDGKSRMGLVR